MLSRLQRWLVRLETLLAGLCILALLGLTLGEILARNFFATGFPAADSLARLLLLYITFLGAALAISGDRHIKVDVIAHWLPAPWQERLFRPVQFLGLIICLFLTVAATRFWWDEWQYASAAERGFVILNLVLPIGFALLSLHFLFGLVLGRHEQTKLPC